MKRKLALQVLVVFPLLTSALWAFGMPGPSDDNRWVAPPEAAKVENPYAEAPDAVEKGGKLFTQQCSPCHGTSGKGDGPAGKFLGKPLPDFTKADVQKQTDGELFWKISHGNAPMPTFKEILSEEQRWMVIDYLRTFRPKSQEGGSR